MAAPDHSRANPPSARAASSLWTTIVIAVLGVSALALAPLAISARGAQVQVQRQVESRVESVAEVFGQFFATSVLAGEDANYEQLQQVVESIGREDRRDFYAFILVQGHEDAVVGTVNPKVIGRTYQDKVAAVDARRASFDRLDGDVRTAERERDEALAAAATDAAREKVALERSERLIALRAAARDEFRELNAARRDLYQAILAEPAKTPGLVLYRALIHDCRGAGRGPGGPEALQMERAASPKGEQARTGICPDDPAQLDSLKAATVLVGIAWTPFLREQQRNLQVLGVATGAALLIGALGAALLARSVTKPVHELIAAMGRVQRGDFEQRVDLHRSDEIGVLARSFNFMASGLAERERLRQEREQLAESVATERKISRELAQSVITEKQKVEQVRVLLSGLASSQVAQQFLEARTELNFSGSTQEATILFADIRGFTTMCERHGPDEIFGMLNDYFARMRTVIDRYGGCILKFMGDALMVSYNVPAAQTHPALRAVYTGIDMQREIVKMNREREAAGKDPINVGIGINTGVLMVGNVGTKSRFDYTVIGDAVNTAQRIESITPAQHLHISESTLMQVGDYVEVVSREPVYLKGKEKPVQIYAVVRRNPKNIVQFE